MKRQMRSERDAVNRDHIAVAVASVASGCWVTRPPRARLPATHTLQGEHLRRVGGGDDLGRRGRRAATLSRSPDESLHGRNLTGPLRHDRALRAGCRGEADILSAAMQADVRAS